MTAADTANAAFREQLARQRDRESRAAVHAALAARLGLAPDAAEENSDDDPPDAAA